MSIRIDVIYDHGGFNTFSDYKIIAGVFPAVHNLVAEYVDVIDVYLWAMVEARMGDDFGGRVRDTVVVGIGEKYYGFRAL